MNETVLENLKLIKQSFRLYMNGVTAQSMREKGVGYKINWGVQIPHLIEMSRQYPKDYSLAVALWKEDIRECKILAAMLMPAEKMPEEVAEIWMEQIVNVELVETTSFYLFQNLSYAKSMAYRWMAGGRELYKLAGFLILDRLFRKGEEPEFREINELLDQVIHSIQADNMRIKQAALNCVQSFAALNSDYECIARQALEKEKLHVL